MATVYKKTYTKPLPDDAELFTRKGERVARWKDAKGKRRTAKVTTGKDGSARIIIEAATWTAKYRNGAGQIVETATGCKTKDAAQAVLVELETRADKVRSGKWTAAEDSVLDHQSTPIDKHVDAYLAALAVKPGKGRRPRVSPHHCANVGRNLRGVVAACGFKRLRDLTRSAVEKWAAQCPTEDMAARTINTHLSAITAFGNWCVETGRLVSNPFTRLAKADEKADRRRQRRALTEPELIKLLKVARLRPLAEYGRETVRREDAADRTEKRSRRTWTRAPLTFDTIDAAAQRGRDVLRKRPAFIAKLEHSGRERALIYKALVLTGLRKGELDSLTVGKLELEGGFLHVMLDAADEKAGRGAEVPVRADLAADLCRWVADKLEAVRTEAKAAGAAIPARLPADTPLLNVPTGLIKILDRDLKAAGIPKRDDRGRTVDVHAMRHTFGTHLSKGGVAPRTAQAAMRHGSLELTMNAYTDPRLLDVAGALDVLPALPLDDEADQQRATGTTDNVACALAPMLAPNLGNHSTPGATVDKSALCAALGQSAVSVDAVDGKQTPSRQVKQRAIGFEPTTSSLGSWHSTTELRPHTYITPI